MARRRGGSRGADVRVILAVRNRVAGPSRGWADQARGRELHEPSVLAPPSCRTSRPRMDVRAVARFRTDVPLVALARLARARAARSRPGRARRSSGLASTLVRALACGSRRHRGGSARALAFDRFDRVAVTRRRAAVALPPAVAAPSMPAVVRGSCADPKADRKSTRL